jgi:hypothetical protein
MKVRIWRTWYINQTENHNYVTPARALGWQTVFAGQQSKTAANPALYGQQGGSRAEGVIMEREKGARKKQARRKPRKDAQFDCESNGAT